MVFVSTPPQNKVLRKTPSSVKAVLVKCAYSHAFRTHVTATESTCNERPNGPTIVGVYILCSVSQDQHCHRDALQERRCTTGEARSMYMHRDLAQTRQPGSNRPGRFRLAVGGRRSAVGGRLCQCVKLSGKLIFHLSAGGPFPSPKRPKFTADPPCLSSMAIPTKNTLRVQVRSAYLMVI